MVKIIEKLYQCEECKLRYAKKELAEECEKFCRANNACNIEITKHAVENEK